MRVCRFVALPGEPGGEEAAQPQPEAEHEEAGEDSRQYGDPHRQHSFGLYHTHNSQFIDENINKNESDFIITCFGVKWYKHISFI